jgi:RNA polymerase sigma factor (sigma-70 family)
MAARTGPVDDDRELARRFAARETDSMRGLYARWAGPVLTVSIRWLGDRHLAEDAVQETFVKAWRASSTFDPQRDLGPWLYTIARRVALDIGRRERRRPATTPLRPSTPAPDGPTIDQVWEAWQVRCALRDLPGDERELIWLAHYVGLTQPQIADRLKLPLGTVKSRSHHAHRHLAERLAHLLTSNPTVTVTLEPEDEDPASSCQRPLVGCLE